MVPSEHLIFLFINPRTIFLYIRFHACSSSPPAKSKPRREKKSNKKKEKINYSVRATWKRIPCNHNPRIGTLLLLSRAILAAIRYLLHSFPFGCTVFPELLNNSNGQKQWRWNKRQEYIMLVLCDHWIQFAILLFEVVESANATHNVTYVPYATHARVYVICVVSNWCFLFLLQFCCSMHRICVICVCRRCAAHEWQPAIHTCANAAKIDRVETTQFPNWYFWHPLTKQKILIR